MNERVRVWAESEAGMTLADFEQTLVAPWRALVAISLLAPSRAFGLQLMTSSPSPKLVYVDPGVVDEESEADPYGLHATFTADDVDFPTFVPRWIALASKNLVPIAAAEPTEENGALQSLVIQAVGAAETLHRYLHPEEPEHPFADRVKQAMGEAKILNSRDRRTVHSILKLSETTLEFRLNQLVAEIGTDFGDWFFDMHQAEWASVCATVRNALAHGFPTDHGVESNHGALVGIYRTMQTVLRLRLLAEAGLKPGEGWIQLLKRDRRYLALVRQEVADWPALREAIRKPQAHDEPERVAETGLET